MKFFIIAKDETLSQHHPTIYPTTDLQSCQHKLLQLRYDEAPKFDGWEIFLIDSEVMCQVTYGGYTKDFASS